MTYGKDKLCVRIAASQQRNGVKVGIVKLATLLSRVEVEHTVVQLVLQRELT